MIYEQPYFLEFRVGLVKPVLREAISRSTLNHLKVFGFSQQETRSKGPRLTALFAFSSSFAMSTAFPFPFGSGSDGTLNTSSCTVFARDSSLGLLVFPIRPAEGTRVSAFCDVASSFRRFRRAEGESSA